MDDLEDLAAGRAAQPLERAEEGHPLVLVNLPRGRARADYGGAVGIEPCSGRDAYLRYAAKAIRVINEVGVR